MNKRLEPVLRTLRLRLTVHFKLIAQQTKLISAQNNTIARQTNQIMQLRTRLADVERVHANLAHTSAERIGELADRCDRADDAVTALEARLNTVEQSRRAGVIHGHDGQINFGWMG